MAKPDIFNDYDEDGFRTTRMGNRSHRAADNAIRDNLRFAFPQYAEQSDQWLVNQYDEFAASDMFGNNDERFPEFVALDPDLTSSSN